MNILSGKSFIKGPSIISFVLICFIDTLFSNFFLYDKLLQLHMFIISKVLVILREKY